MADITLQQVAEGIRAAEAAGDTAAVTMLRAAYREMERQQPPTAGDLPVPGSPSPAQPPVPAEGDYRQSYVGQGMSGLNEGIALGLGGLVDLANLVVGKAMSDINSVAGTNFQPSAKPFGGSEMWLELLAPTIYEPSTDPGKQMVRRVTQELGTMAPMVLPFGMLSKTPVRTIAAETTAATTGGTAAAVTQQIAPGNKGAETAASIVGGFGPAAVAATLRRMLGTSIPASLEALRETKIASYTDADELGARYKRSAVKQLGKTIAGTIAGQAINSSGQVLANEVLDEIRRLGKKGKPQPSLNELNELHQRVRAAANSVDQGEAAIARLISDDIDQFIDSASTGSFKSESPAQAGPTVEAALVANQRLRNSELIAEVVQKAREAARGVGLDSNIMRDGMRAIINDQRKYSRFSPDEQRLIRQLAEDGPTDKLLGSIAKFAPSDSKIAEVFTSLAPLLNETLASIPLAGTTAKLAPDLIAAGQATRLQDAVQSAPPVKRFYLTDADKAAMAAVPGVAAVTQNRPDLGLAAWLSRNGHDDLAAQLAAGKLTPRAAYEASRQRPPASWPF